MSVCYDWNILTINAILANKKQFNEQVLLSFLAKKCLWNLEKCFVQIV